MANLHVPSRSARPAVAPPAFAPQALDTIEIGQSRRVFARDIEALVMQACRAKGLGFDLFATRFNVPRATLLDILRGHAPVSSQTRRVLEDFLQRTLGADGVGAAAQSPVATRRKPL